MRLNTITAQTSVAMGGHLPNLCLLPCGCAPKFVKGNVEPLINVSMDLVVFVTDLLWRQAFL